ACSNGTNEPAAWKKSASRASASVSARSTGPSRVQPRTRPQASRLMNFNAIAKRVVGKKTAPPGRRPFFNHHAGRLESRFQSVEPTPPKTKVRLPTRRGPFSPTRDVKSKPPRLEPNAFRRIQRLRRSEFTQSQIFGVEFARRRFASFGHGDVDV